MLESFCVTANYTVFSYRMNECPMSRDNLKIHNNEAKNSSKPNKKTLNLVHGDVTYCKNFKRMETRGIWVAQSVKHPTLDFDSGHDLKGF